MKLKRLTAVILIIIMMLSLLSGCKRGGDAEDALSDALVEGEEYLPSGDAPAKAEDVILHGSGGGSTEKKPQNSATSPENSTAQPEEQPDRADDDSAEPDSVPEEKPNNVPPQKDDLQQDNTPNQAPIVPDDNQSPLPDNSLQPDDVVQPDDGYYVDPDDEGGEQEDEEEEDYPDEDEDAGTDSTKTALIKVVDYNIRCANDGENKMITDRAPRLFALLEKYNPDIIGLQEAVPEWIWYMENGIEDHEKLTAKYELRYKYRAGSSLECTPILWKKDKFQLLDEGYYWLSETPDEESKGWGSEYYRICMWVKLKVKATGSIFIFVNTHMSGGTPSTNSAPLIANRTRREGGFSQYPVILTGDFNVAPRSAAYNALLNNGFSDLNDAMGFNEDYTNNGYNERPDNSSSNSIKDYIMFGGSTIDPLRYQILNEKYYNGWISDHRGLYGEFSVF